MIEASELSGLSGIRHGFFTRQKGVSGGIYASLNVGLGSDDRSDDVLENRRRVAQTFGLGSERLSTLHQIHSADVIEVKQPEDARGRKADAMVTDQPDILLGVLTADCAPVLFADADGGVIGAAHAGWGGAFRGVTDATIEAMEGLGAQRKSIVAVIGPCIAQASYEVGPEFLARFTDKNTANGCYFIPSDRPDHHRFDLAGYLLDRLREEGVSACTWTGHDTFADDARFFSYRRSVHRKEGDYGRQISAIMLAEGDC